TWAKARAMTRAASGGTMPASASAPASARSKSSIARTNASADSAWVKESRAKPRPTMFTSAARALVLDEHRFAGAAQAHVPAIELGILLVAGRDQRAEPLGIADGAGQGIVLDRFERGEEDAGLQRLEKSTREDRDTDLRHVGLAARALVRAGHDGLDRIAAVGVRGDAAVAVGSGAVVTGEKLSGRVRLPGLEERIDDRRAGAVEHASAERDAVPATREQNGAAVLPQEVPREERPDCLRGSGFRHLTPPSAWRAGRSEPCPSGSRARHLRCRAPDRDRR